MSNLRALIFGFIAVLLYSVCGAQEPEVEASASIAFEKLEIGEHTAIEFTIPDKAIVHLRVDVPADQRALMQLDKEAVRAGSTWNIEFTPLVSGDQTIGPFDLVAVTEMGEEITLQAPAVQVTIPSPSTNAELQDYTQPLRAPTNWTLIVLVSVAGILAFALLLLLLAWIFRKFRSESLAAAAAAPPMPPIDEAIGALQYLKPLDIYRSQGTNAHYTELSMLIRRYFERQEKVPALEWTEDEITYFITRQFSGGNARALDEVFAHASAAKFAQIEFEEKVVREDLALTERFLETERSRLEQLRLQAKAQASAQEAA